MSGFIYLMSNPAMPGCAKIGYTDANPVDRAFQLSTTSVPMPFEVDFFWFVEDAAQIEQEVHAALENMRVKMNREFFQGSSVQLSAIVSRVIGNRAICVWSAVDGRDAAEAANSLLQGVSTPTVELQVEPPKSTKRWILDLDSKSFYTESSPQTCLDVSSLRLVPNTEIRCRDLRIPLTNVTVKGDGKVSDVVSKIDVRYERAK